MKKTLIILLVALIAMTAVFAQGAAETKSSGPMTITMLYAATQTEVGSLPDDWAGYQILRDKLGIDLQLQMLPSNANDQNVAVRTMAAADELPDFLLRLLRKAVKEEKPDAVIIGEVWEDASNKIAYDELREYFYGDELDSVMNYPLKNAMVDFLYLR